MTLQNSLSIDSHRDGQVVFVHLTGDFDLTGVETFRDEMELVQQSDPQEVVLDLQRLTFMDSTGIRMILGAQSQCRALSIIPGPSNVMRVLEIAGVDSRLSLFSQNGDGAATSQSGQRVPTGQKKA